jgi:hypothetical protein
MSPTSSMMLKVGLGAYVTTSNNTLQHVVGVVLDITYISGGDGYVDCDRDRSVRGTDKPETL